MNRYEQRKIKFLQDPEVAEGYREMATELQSALRAEINPNTVQIGRMSLFLKEHLLHRRERRE